MNGDVVIPVTTDGANGVNRKWSVTSEKLTYSWQNLNIFVSTTQGCGKKKKIEEKHILKDVTGLCRPGELLAIMGASGAGKTSLLNALTFRSDRALKITGSLYVNGQKVSPQLLTSRSAYVQQEDLFIGTFTVKEQLTFQANLRMDRKISQKQRKERINEVMGELSLAKCANTLIGVPGRLKGISGGETKRLAFACEVLTNPPLMFCDEPTSGLDSFMAQNIVQAMKDLADKGKTIISTIHQPSSEVFALFDRVLLMAEGRVAYLGSTTGALKFFAGLGRQCPSSYNPADFFVSTLAIQPEFESECREFVHQTCDTFASSGAGQEIVNATVANSQSNMNGEMQRGELIKTEKSPYKASWFEQYRAVLRRAILENIREPMVLRVKLFQTILVSLLVGIIYWNQPLNQDGVTNINGALFLLLTQMSFQNVFGVVNTFCTQLPIFLREHFNGMYRTDVYYMSKNVAESPFTIFQPLLFVAIMYYMIGLNPGADKFFICVAIIILVANAAVSFGFMISCLAKTLNMALALSAPLLIPLMLFGGYFLNSQSVPVYFIWIQYISWFNYGNEALMINQWSSYEDIDCTDLQRNLSLCLGSGAEVLDQMGYDENNLGLDIGLLFALIAGYRITGFLLLVSKTYRKTVKSYSS